MFDVLDFINDDKINLVIGEDVADKLGGVGLLEFLEVENKIVMFGAISVIFLQIQPVISLSINANLLAPIRSVIERSDVAIGGISLLGIFLYANGLGK